ncbi:hypothetical protein B0T18DRAFT_475381, partial [Schizothecium vesticola]
RPPFARVPTDHSSGHLQRHQYTCQLFASDIKPVHSASSEVPRMAPHWRGVAETGSENTPPARRPLEPLGITSGVRPLSLAGPPLVMPRIDTSVAFEAARLAELGEPDVPSRERDQFVGFSLIRFTIFTLATLNSEPQARTHSHPYQFRRVDTTIVNVFNDWDPFSRRSLPEIQNPPRHSHSSETNNDDTVSTRTVFPNPLQASNARPPSSDFTFGSGIPRLVGPGLADRALASRQRRGRGTATVGTRQVATGPLGDNSTVLSGSMDGSAMESLPKRRKRTRESGRQGVDERRPVKTEENSEELDTDWLEDGEDELWQEARKSEA